MKQCFFWILLCSPLAWGQTDTNHTTTNQTELKLLTPDPVNVAQFLRAEYPLDHAAYLTQLAWEIAHSFASKEQWQEQWQQAIELAVPESQNHAMVDSHALVAQILIQFSNGMNLNRWRQDQLPIIPQWFSPKVQDNNHFNTWVNLNHMWHNLLQDRPETAAQLAHQLQTEWPKASSKDNQLPTFEDILSDLNDTDFNLDQWLSHIQSTEVFEPLTLALLRQHQHQQNQQNLSFALDWVHIYQLVELSPHLYTSAEQHAFTAIIEQAKTHWQAVLDGNPQFDVRWPGLLIDLLNELPNKFKNPDHISTTINQRVMSLLLGLNIPADYFEHPLRNTIQENLEVCLNLSLDQLPEPPVPIAGNQFNSCIDDFLRWANTSAYEAGLAGNQIQLDSPNSLYRALELPPFQIVNNLQQSANAVPECQLDMAPNWLEWLLAAESLAWLHDRWPGLMVSENRSAELQAMIEQGQHLTHQADCLNRQQPLQQQYNHVLADWQRLRATIKQHVNDYATERLSEGHDIDLFEAIDQTTQHVPADFGIKACDVTTACGAYVKLAPTPQLMNQFPNHLRLAEQFGLGQLSICYDQVEWTERESEPTHLNNNKIANFSGLLSVQLQGMFNDQVVFTTRHTSTQRHIYLFGENNQATLDTACPLPLIGQRITTTLDRGTFGLLPNRLTFLAAQKTDINSVISKEWSEWASQAEAKPNILNDFSEVKADVNAAFLSHVNTLQQQVYRKLTTSNPSRANDSALSKAIFDYLNQVRLLQHMAQGLYPNASIHSNLLQAALKGPDRLPDASYFRQAFANNINVQNMLAQGDRLFKNHENAWDLSANRSAHLAHTTLVKLRQIRQTFFGLQPETKEGQ